MTDDPDLRDPDLPDPDLHTWARALEAERPDPARRARDLARARAAFDGLHAAPRAPARRPWRLWPAAGGGLGAAVAAVGLLVLTPAGRDLWERPAPAGEARPDAAPAPAPAPAPARAVEEESAAAPPEAPRARREGPAEAARGTADAAQAPTPAPAPAPVPTAPLALEQDAGPSAGPVAPGPPAARAAEAPLAVPGDALAAVRRALEAGARPPPGSVRLEAVLAQVLADPPGPGAAFAATSDAGPVRAAAWATPAPWDPARRLVVVALSAPGATVRGVEARPDGESGAVERLGGDGPTLRADLVAAGGAVAAAWEVAPDDAADGAAGGAGRLVLSWDGGRADLSLGGGAEARLAAAVTGWALLLGGEDLGAWGLGEAAALAAEALGPEPSGARAEVLDLMRLSAALP